MTTRQLNIKNRSYYFYNDLINILNFEASNLKIDKKSWKDIDIYYVGYVDEKPDWNVNSVNPLYLIVNRVYGSVVEKNGIKFLSIDNGDAVLKEYDQVFAGIKFHIGKIDGYEKIRFLSNDAVSLGKLVYFPTMTVIINCVFKQNGICYPQVHLDDCLYQI